MPTLFVYSRIIKIMKELLNKKSIKVALTLLLITLFSVTLCPALSPVINIVRMFVGS